MLQFCLHGLTDEAKTMKVNTPRTRVIVRKGYTEIENENFPLNTSAFYGHVNIVRHLLAECNASTATENHWEETPFRSAQWAWRETAISDPVRSENCFNCMQLIHQYENRSTQSIDETFRGQAHRQNQVDLARRYRV